MRLTVRLLGLDLLAIELNTDPPAYEAGEDDCSRDLSGGNLVSDRLDAGPTDWHMGFTNGREVDE